MPMMGVTMAADLGPRWYPLRYHRESHDLVNCGKRFRVAAAGRRSGKTEHAKRYGVMRALEESRIPDLQVIFAAPTRDQAKEIYWDDLKLLVPSKRIVGEPRESDLKIKLVNGATIRIVGMDKPHRVEGDPIDWICLDEYADMKPDAWTKSVSPAVDTDGRPGEVWFIGKPKGRNHYHQLFEAAKDPGMEDWAAFTWPSSDILSPDTIAAAKQRMDRLSFEQEYEASFLNFTGRAYYDFKRETHAREALKYDDRDPLIFCFDFNRSPGVAAVIQEQTYDGNLPDVAKTITGVIGEVWIPEHSNTGAVCRKLKADWRSHRGRVICYGDATGGAGGSAKERGSDWDIIERELRPTFGGRLSFRVPRSNPPERSRVNATNYRIKWADGTIKMLVDPFKAEHVVLDFEGTKVLEGGSGELDKRTTSGNKDRTHISDAIGYYVVAEHPNEVAMDRSRLAVADAGVSF